MRKQLVRSAIIGLLISCFYTATAIAHPGGHGSTASDELRIWTNAASGESIKAAFLMARDGRVYLEQASGEAIAVPLNELAAADRHYAEAQIERIRQRHNQSVPSSSPATSEVVSALATLLAGLTTAFFFRRSPRLAVGVCLAIVLVCGVAVRHQAQTNRPALAAAFDKYSPKVKTRWDNQYLYVESDGLPDHPMMIGIRAWQQQVPLPQPYTGNNAWQIPLKPVLASQPISAKTALFRGAIALAVNGVPIFNALNNRGADSFAIGELDEWGGHCGRADDYHYHAAPLHIQQKVGTTQPIAYALDGFPLYGLNEPDGKPARPLDEFNGHADKADTYHYHSTKTYPYINGGLRGVVTVREDQIDPQPRAAPVRQYTQPLRGATITDFKTVGPNHWQLKYKLQGKTHEVNYNLSDNGNAEFTFVDGDGKGVTEHYSRRDTNRRPEPPPPPNDDRRPQRRPPEDANRQPPPPPDGRQPRRNPDDQNQPRTPWIIVHAKELDANNDGVVTMQEIIAEVNATFAAFHRNADSKLSAEEYGQARGIRRVLAGFVTQHAKEIDGHGDGIITPDELMATVKRMFGRADRNNDGKLTADELNQDRKP